MMTFTENAAAPRAENREPDSRPTRRRDGIEVSIAYALIVLTVWTPRPTQRWLYMAALIWVAVSTWASFSGWRAMGFRRDGFWRSLWVVAVALGVAAGAVTLAVRLHTLHSPHDALGWIKAFGGYAIWTFMQQFLLQAYFLLRLERLLPSRRWAAVTAAGIFAVAHLPNPILTPITLIWGICACFVFLRRRNIYPLALAHAILGISVAITIPPPVLHNMRVGLGYLRYHAPRVQTPQT